MIPIYHIVNTLNKFVVEIKRFSRDSTPILEDTILTDSYAATIPNEFQNPQSIYFNGKTGFGTASPQATIDVKGGALFDSLKVENYVSLQPTNIANVPNILGTMAIDSTDNTLKFYDGTVWRAILLKR